MKNNAMRTATVFTAAVISLGLLLSGCGGSSDDSGSSDSGALDKQPADGVPSSYTGTLPQPDVTERYDNPQDRDNVEDGGTLTLSTYEITANWNLFSADGGTTAMSALWGWYQPVLTQSSEVGGIPVEPNKDYISNMELVSEDPMVVQYDINPDAKYNDGTDIDWTSFKTTWEANNGSNPDYNPPSTDGFDSIEKVEQGDSAKQAIVTYKTPYYPWQSVFWSFVNPKAADADTFTSGWVNDPHNDWAAGPYIVDSSDESQVTFVPNPNWWGDAPKLDKVIYKQMEDTAAVNAFANGEIDTVDVTTADQIKTVRGVKDTQLRYSYSTRTRVFTYNGQSAPLDDINVRKAITQAFDSSTYNAVQFQGLDWDAAQPGSLILMPYQEGYEDNMPEDSKFSVDNAKKTLEDAGYTLGDDGYYAKDGTTLEVSFTYFGDDATQEALGKTYQELQKSAGIKVKLVNKPVAEFSDTIVNGDYQVLPMAWESTNAMSFVTAISQFYTSDGDSNFSFVGSDEIDGMVKEPGKHSDYDEQAEAANKAEKAALELYGQIPVSTPPLYKAVKTVLANYGPAGFANVAAQDVGWQKE